MDRGSQLDEDEDEEDKEDDEEDDEEEEEAGGGRRRQEEDQATNIKSNNPHLAGGEKRACRLRNDVGASFCQAENVAAQGLHTVYVDFAI